MPYRVHIKKNVSNEIGGIIKQPIKEFTITDLVITDGLIHKGSYSIPIQSILFIEEI